mgnify:CR=1 FL=1
MKLIRVSRHTLKYANKDKLALCSKIMSDFKDLVQLYLNLIHSKELPLKVLLSSSRLPILNDIAQARWRNLAYKEASAIYRGLLTKWKKYKNKFSLPKIQTQNINLHLSLWDIEYTPDGEFDGFIRIKSPYFQEGKKRTIKFNVPFRFHKQSNKFKDNGWTMNNTIRLTKNDLCFYWSKEQDEKRTEGTQIGIDCGYKKLIACSDGDIYGSELEEVYKKIVETGKDKYIIKLILFMMNFIEQYKTTGYDEGGFEILRKKTDNPRTLLFLDIAEKTEFKITKIEINDVNDQTYFSSIYMFNEALNKEIQIDSRPSDAIAVALRADVPIFVTTNVLAAGLVSTDVEKDEQEAQEFKSFIKDIKPSDFEKLLKKNFESDQ